MRQQHFDTQNRRLTVGIVGVCVLAFHGLILQWICHDQNVTKTSGIQEKVFESFITHSPRDKESPAQITESTQPDAPSPTPRHVIASELNASKIEYFAAKKTITSSKNNKPYHSEKHSSNDLALSDPVGDPLSDPITPPVAQKGERNHPPPPYPKSSRRLGERGKVVLAVEVDLDGSVAQVIVKKSSGYIRLDQSALNTIRTWRFIPGNKAGTPQKMWATIPINFVLE